MINPGGSVTKSAATRLNNSQVSAAQATMPFNAAAQQSLRNTYSKQNKSGPPVGPKPNPSTLPGLEPQQQVQVPTGGPQGPESMAEGFDPAVFAEQQLDQIVGEIRTQQFTESPRVKDAMESIRFRNLMNADNPRYIKDPRPLFEQVVSKIGMG